MAADGFNLKNECIIPSAALRVEQKAVFKPGPNTSVLQDNFWESRKDEQDHSTRNGFSRRTVDRHNPLQKHTVGSSTDHGFRIRRATCKRRIERMQHKPDPGWENLPIRKTCSFASPTGISFTIRLMRDQCPRYATLYIRQRIRRKMPGV
ncbi:hypothetical protein P153DRAFT_355792 [Dothidotthia symphoricarpi CBS 119687]|uniref:Uncharacterized protein n=1 Tax=Dothidotthia symphoricarpi CBS 119687 TaxID=1392245 RepID=A0A6A6AKN4_9PLEO|nr:uncharacterized protein P153DRAFT_355792 [Dothidotthia symphoricarpi CBS 119687]KAF2131001.1 hypothetical protein P153DRAFT_355792 [Dothidotthia symphoricarpi CBS 119687]